MGVAFAHEGLFHGEASAFGSMWTLDPLVLVPLGLAIYLYVRGRRRARRLGVVVSRRWEGAAWWTGVAALLAALVWPLDRLGEALFSAHMAQHLVLMNVAAPLLVLGAPLPAFFHGLAPGARRVLGACIRPAPVRGAWRLATGFAFATLLHLAVLWAWHTPAGVAAALANEAVHVTMHASLFAAALLFWSAVLHPAGDAWWKAAVAAVATLKVNGLVCIVMLLRTEPAFLAYGDGARAYGLDPASDEHLGWGVMMVLGSMSYLAAAVGACAIGLRRLELRHAAGTAPRAPTP